MMVNSYPYFKIALNYALYDWLGGFRTTSNQNQIFMQNTLRSGFNSLFFGVIFGTFFGFIDRTLFAKLELSVKV